MNWIYTLEIVYSPCYPAAVSQTGKIDDVYFTSKEDAKTYLRTIVRESYEAMADFDRTEGKDIELTFIDNLDSDRVFNDFVIQREYPLRNLTNFVIYSIHALKPGQLYTKSKCSDELDYDVQETSTDDPNEI